MDWVASLNSAIEYIENHLTENLNNSNIARHVFLSGAHFQRAFTLMTGITVGEYIRCRRLTLAGHELTQTGAKVVDTAYKYGYETPESFSKAFSRFHGCSPMEAKRGEANLKSLNRLSIKIILEGAIIMDYRIVKEEAFEVVVKAKRFGNEQDSAKDVPAFWDEYFAEELHLKVSPDLGVCEPHTEGSGSWRYGIGCNKDSVHDIPDGFEVWAVPQNTWAVFKCVGAMPKAIQDMWKRIFSEWLPQAKYEMAQTYDFEKYFTGDTASDDYISEIWIPIKEKC